VDLCKKYVVKLLDDVACCSNFEPVSVDSLRTLDFELNWLFFMVWLLLDRPLIAKWKQGNKK